MSLRKRLRPDPHSSFRLEEQSGASFVVGLDEVGRGPLAGPVVAAAVGFHPQDWQSDEPEMLAIGDSKRIVQSTRDRLYEFILNRAAFVEIAMLSAQEVDRLNILQASFEAFRRCLLRRRSDTRPIELVLIDGHQPVPGLSIRQHPVVAGDKHSKSIAAASIVAKVFRDRWMQRWHSLFPDYGFASHKGYGTRAHLEAIERLGPSEIHRRSFLKRFQNQARGRQAESEVLGDFERRGYSLIERNWRCALGEIDLIFVKSSSLYFVEVRSGEDVGAAFPATKQSKLRALAEEYRRLHPAARALEARVDCVLVSRRAEGKSYELQILKDALAF